MGQILANWDESDGSPYEYGSGGLIYQVEEPIWKCVPEEDCKFFYDGSKKELKSVLTGNLSLWTLHLIENVEITTLIHDHSEDCLSDIEIDEKSLTTPLKIYLNYPFSQTVEAVIQPLILKVVYDDERQHPFFPVGYLFWQIAKVYADIYKNHWKEVGVWGHDLSDLVANGCVIYEDYTARVILSS